MGPDDFNERISVMLDGRDDEFQATPGGDGLLEYQFKAVVMQETERVVRWLDNVGDRPLSGLWGQLIADVLARPTEQDGARIRDTLLASSGIWRLYAVRDYIGSTRGWLRERTWEVGATEGKVWLAKLELQESAGRIKHVTQRFFVKQRLQQKWGMTTDATLQDDVMLEVKHVPANRIVRVFTIDNMKEFVGPGSSVDEAAVLMHALARYPHLWSEELVEALFNVARTVIIDAFLVALGTDGIEGWSNRLLARGFAIAGAEGKRVLMGVLGRRGEDVKATVKKEPGIG